MANKIFIHFVENQCKNPCKNRCISNVKLCEKNLIQNTNVQNNNLFTTFFNFIHHHFHNKPPLNSSYFFHYSTNPTITTINKLIIRKD